MSLSKEAQKFADVTPLHINDKDFPNFCGPIILELMKEGHTDLAISEAMVDGMADALKDIDPLPADQRQPMIDAACGGIVAQLRAGHKLAHALGAEAVIA